MQSFKHNFNDGVELEVKVSEWRKGQYVLSISTRESYISRPELEALRDSIDEMLKDDDNGPNGEDRESSLPQGDDEESLEDLLSEKDAERS